VYKHIIDPSAYFVDVNVILQTCAVLAANVITNKYHIPTLISTV
jgi:hypothetical protein